MWRGRSRQKSLSPFRRSTQGCYGPQGSGRSAGGKCRRLRMNEKVRKWKGMEDSRSKRYAHFMCGHDMRAKDRLEPRDVVCNQVWRKRNKTNSRTARTFTSHVNVHVRCVESALGLGGHVVIGVVLSFTTQTQYQVYSSFLLDFVVHFCTCSQTAFCDGQFSSVANYCTLFYRENGSFEVLSLQEVKVKWCLLRLHLLLEGDVAAPPTFPEEKWANSKLPKNAKIKFKMA